MLTIKRGVEIAFTKAGPKMLERLLHRAWLRRLERDLANKEADNGVEFGRVHVGHVRCWLKSCARKKDPRGPIARGVICGSKWTKSRAAAVGYAISPLCDLCGEAEDTPHHRTWCCCAVDEKRKSLAPDWLIREAREAEPGN